MSELQVSRLWRFGPGWLSLGSTPNDLPDMPEECSHELKASVKKVHNLVAMEARRTIGEVIECGQFSSSGTW